MDWKPRIVKKQRVSPDAVKTPFGSNIVIEVYTQINVTIAYSEYDIIQIKVIRKCCLYGGLLFSKVNLLLDHCFAFKPVSTGILQHLLL